MYPFSMAFSLKSFDFMVITYKHLFSCPISLIKVATSRSMSMGGFWNTKKVNYSEETKKVLNG